MAKVKYNCESRYRIDIWYDQITIPIRVKRTHTDDQGANDPSQRLVHQGGSCACKRFRRLHVGFGGFSVSCDQHTRALAHLYARLRPHMQTRIYQKCKAPWNVGGSTHGGHRGGDDHFFDALLCCTLYNVPSAGYARGHDLQNKGRAV